MTRPTTPGFTPAGSGRAGSRRSAGKSTLKRRRASLGMTAAAEALPAALDEAKAANLSHQDFLERLLSVEVEAVDERRRASLGRPAIEGISKNSFKKLARRAGELPAGRQAIAS